MSRYRLVVHSPPDAPPVPVKLTDPTLASTPPATYEVGVPLVVTPGTYSHATISGYRWYRSDNSLIGGASDATYTPTASEQDFSVYAVEVATGPGGSLETSTNTVGPVQPAVEPSPYTIDDAEAEIEAEVVNFWAGMGDVTTWDTDTTVTTVAGLATAVAACFSTGSSSIAITRKHRITVDWDGIQTYGAGMTTNFPVSGYASRTDGHYDNGGGIYITAAPGRTPAIANMFNIWGVRGIHIRGIGLARKWSGSGDSADQAALQFQCNTTRPARPIIKVEACPIGVAYHYPSDPAENWVGACQRNGSAPDYIEFKDCPIWGCQNATKLAVKRTWVRGCDYQLARQDLIPLYGHTEAGYFAYAVLDNNTFRNAADALVNRSEHMDIVQTGVQQPASAPIRDLHLGYRVLIRGCLGHLNHRYAGLPGLGGGTQGSYNDDYIGKVGYSPGADNQFVLRDTTFLVSSPNGFIYFSYAVVTKKSFADRCTFMRCGMVPSGLPGDGEPAQDFGIGITGSGNGAPNASGQKWMKATNCIVALALPTGSYFEGSGNVVCDPRNTSTVTNPADRPEAFFRDRDTLFQRGEYTAGKFSYHLPGEDSGSLATPIASTRTQAEFVADVWSTFEPSAAYTGKGAPDPTGNF